MKVRVFRAPELLMAEAARARTILRGSRHLLAKHWPLILLVAAATILAAFALFPRDAQLLASLHSSALAQKPATLRLAAFFGTWGDYPTYNLPLAVGIWAYGYWKKDRAWRRVALVCLLGATFAGLFDDCFRLTLGRPRPDAHMPDGFYGLNDAWHSRFQSFPSGHAAAVCGTAAALLLVRPWLGWLTLAYALIVIWARLELYRHYPSDVAVGALIGMLFGSLAGYGAQVRDRRRPAHCPP